MHITFERLKQLRYLMPSELEIQELVRFYAEKAHDKKLPDERVEKPETD